MLSAKIFYPACKVLKQGTRYALRAHADDEDPGICLFAMSDQGFCYPLDTALSDSLKV